MNWNLECLCKNDMEFEARLDEIKELVEKVKDYNGKMCEEEGFKGFYLLNLELEEKLGPTYMYAHLLSDLDKRDVNNAAKVSKCISLLNKFGVYASFEEPEVLALGYEKAISFINNNKEIEQFRFHIENMFRKAEHILDAKSEKLLSIVNPAMNVGGDMYSALTVADGKSEKIKINSNVVEVTQGNWRSLIEGEKDAKNRKKIFESLYKFYEEHKNAYAKIYEGILESNKAFAKAKNFDSILDAYLFRNNIPTSVYTNLVNVASKKNASLKKYIKLRKKYLGLKNHYSYDRFLELASSTKKYEYSEAKELFFDSIKSCPKDFQDKAHSVLEEGYVDVYEKTGKRSGAYSSSMANIHPFILLNFSNTLDDVFTLAHEAGHSIHSMYSQEAQPTMLQDYTIFVAEIASTFNEHLLLDYLMEKDDLSNDDKIMLLQKAIDSIISTFYRQTLFADFELRANKLIENDMPINHEVLSEIMIDLYKQYYGIDIKKEKVKKYVWCYIPHMYYTPFYVYQYATSFAASFKLYKNVKEDKENGFTNYINLLKAGGSKYPIDEAKDAGVDFTKKDTFMAVVERMDELVDKLEKLLNE